MKDIAQIRADNANPSVKSKTEEIRQVKRIVAASFQGPVAQWEQILLLEYVGEIPIREGR